ncbi:MAG: DNA replication/repair protein RecF, partial [Wenzhouxiangellaceae bacterium]
IHVLARGRSFRAGTLGPVIQDGSRSFTVFARTAEPEHRLGIERLSGRWSGRLDGAACSRVSDFARRLPLVLIDPENHQLLEGGPPLRRNFIDWGVFHVEHSYLEIWRRYARLLRQRNAALRDAASPAVLESLERPMADAAETLEQTRKRWVRSLAESLEVLEPALSFRLDSLRLEYRSSCASATEYRETWAANRERDLEQGYTREGPHRAEMVVRSGERPAATRLSRGQMKLAALLLKLAQMKQADSAGQVPMLLLDDPVSELDGDHLNRLLGWLERQPGQVWITAVLPPAGVNGRLFHVEQGKITSMV